MDADIAPQANLAQGVANRRGVAATALAMSCLVINDAFVKHVGQSLPTGQLIFIRGAFAVLLLLLLVRIVGVATSAQLRLLAQPKVLLRALLDALGTFAYLASMVQLPIANATAINMSAPLFITLFAVLIFGERVSAGRWLAICAGFAGVLLIVQPNAAAFNGYSLLCLLGTLLQALRDLSSRRVPVAVSPIVVTLATALVVLLLSGAFVAAQPWQAPAVRELALLFAASAFLSAGYYLIFIGMRAGEFAVVAPFRYVGLLVALALGWLIWDDVPNLLAWIGIALMAAAGIAVLQGGRRSAAPSGHDLYVNRP